MTDQEAALKAAREFMSEWGMQPVSVGIERCAGFILAQRAEAIEQATPEIERLAKIKALKWCRDTAGVHADPPPPCRGVCDVCEIESEIARLEGERNA